MLAPGVMVIKISKMAHLLYFLLMIASESASGRSYLVISENAMDFWILNYHYQHVNP